MTHGIRCLATLLIPAAMLAGSCIPAGTAEPGAALTVEVRARSIAPGEPLRVVVRSTEPLETLEAEFLGRSVFMDSVGDEPDGKTWAGWSMVGLDDEAGVAAVEVRGSSRSGAPVAGTHAVTIETKVFPEEHLEVAGKYVAPPAEARERLAREREKLARIYRERAPLASSSPFVRPVPGDPTSTFGLRRIYNGEPRSPHPGLDLRAASETPVLCSGAGRVVLAQDLYYSGNTVIVDHGGGLFTIYAHLSAIHVEEGQPAGAGDTLGLSGATGRVTGPHLHWGAKIGNRPFDPTALLDRALFD